MKRVLVTGASGFIGRHTLGPLAERGFEVHVADLAAAGREIDGVVWHQVDLLAPGGPARAIAAAKPTHLLHLAWYAVHRRFWIAPENLAWVSASLDLIRAFRDGGGTRAVFAGTCVEYDGRLGWCSETATPLAPTTVYGSAKDALRRVLEAYARQEHLSVAWGRLFLLHGPFEHPDRLVPAAVNAMLRGAPTRCTHGRQVRDLMHAADAGAALVALLDSRVDGAVNVATGEPRTLRAIVETAARLIGTPALAKFGDVDAPAGEPPFLVADVRRLTDEVGFRPRFDLESGLADSIEWWRSRIGDA